MRVTRFHLRRPPFPPSCSLIFACRIDNPNPHAYLNYSAVTHHPTRTSLQSYRKMMLRLPQSLTQVLLLLLLLLLLPLLLLLLLLLRPRLTSMHFYVLCKLATLSLLFAFTAGWNHRPLEQYCCTQRSMYSIAWFAAAGRPLQQLRASFGSQIQR